MVNYGELRQLKHHILYPECGFRLTLHPWQKHSGEPLLDNFALEPVKLMLLQMYF